MVRELSAHGPDDLWTPQRPDLHRDGVLLSATGLIHASTGPESTAPTTEETDTDSG